MPGRRRLETVRHSKTTSIITNSRFYIRIEKCTPDGQGRSRAPENIPALPKTVLETYSQPSSSVLWSIHRL